MYVTPRGTTTSRGMYSHRSEILVRLNVWTHKIGYWMADLYRYTSVGRTHKVVSGNISVSKFQSFRIKPQWTKTVWRPLQITRGGIMWTGLFGFGMVLLAARQMVVDAHAITVLLAVWLFGVPFTTRTSKVYVIGCSRLPDSNLGYCKEF